MTLALVVAVTALGAVPGPASPEKSDVHTAMVFNVLVNSSRDEASLDAIDEAMPDILCLREVGPRFAQRFVKRFDARYPHRKYRSHPQPSYGVALASRYPIVEWRVFLERPYNIPAADAVVRIGADEVRIVCVHLIPPLSRYERGEGMWETMDRNTILRKRQAKYIAYRFRNESRPTMILGDFNEDPDDPAMQLLVDRGFENSCFGEPEGCQMSWPAWFGFFGGFRFDQILGRKMTFVSSRVVEKGGSDHFPVMVEFQVERPVVVTNALRTPPR